MVIHRGCRHAPQRFYDLHLLIADAVGFEAVWGLHGNKAEKLHQVVLNHIPQLAYFVVVRPSALDAHHLSDGNLHVINTAMIPLTINEAISEAQNQKVLNGLFAQLVINSVDGLLIKVASNRVIHRSGGLEALTDRFL